MSKNKPVFNLVDRVVAAVSPAAGLRRLQARHALASALPAYEAASPSRHRKFYSNTQSPNQLTQLSANAIKAQARQLHRNHDLSRGILRTMVNNMVGPNGIGVEFQPRRADGTIHEPYAAALRKAWREFCLRPEVTGRHTMAKVQRMMALTWIRDGEAFAQELVGTVPGLRHGSAVPLSLEMFEGDLVPWDYSNTYPMGGSIEQGIERDAWGRPRAFYVYKKHPAEGVGVAYGSGDLKRVPADRVHHIALLDRIGQMRGVSEFASIITRLEDIKDYEESERIAAKIAAALTAYVKKTSPDGYVGAQLDENGEPISRQLSMAPGMIIDDLAVGEEIGMIDSNRPNPNVVTFRGGQLRAIAAGVGVSYSSAAKDYNGTFSAQRQELVEQWVNYATLTDEFVGQFLQPLVDTFVSVADIAGVVRRPRDVAPEDANDAMFLAQSMPWIDPLKEANAYVTLTRAGFASEVEVMRKRGVNPRDVLEQLSSWRTMTADKGLTLTSDGANSESKGATPEPADPAQTAAAVAAATAGASATANAGQHAEMMAMIAAMAAKMQAAQVAPVVNVAAPATTLAFNSQSLEDGVKATLADLREVYQKQVEDMPIVVNVAAADAPVVNVHVDVPKAEAPIVNITNEVTSAPAQVTVQHPTQAVQRVERNKDGEILRTVTDYTNSNP
jgi:lambda family phage portal protein